MKIAQITDLHLADDGESAFDIDNYTRTHLVIKDALRYKPDKWIFTGDISLYSPHKKAYKFLKSCIEKYNLDAHVIAGNHDYTNMMTEIIYGHSTDRFYHMESTNLCDIIYLDTHDAEISNEESEMIRNLDLNRKPLLIFMHHPPIIAGVPYMDSKYPFSDEEGREKFMRLIESTGRKCYIYCGHYHNPRCLSNNNWQVEIAPPVHIQIDDATSEFNILSKNPGYKIIEVKHDRLVSSWNRIVSC